MQCLCFPCYWVAIILATISSAIRLHSLLWVMTGFSCVVTERCPATSVRYYAVAVQYIHQYQSHAAGKWQRKCHRDNTCMHFFRSIRRCCWLEKLNFTWPLCLRNIIINKHDLFFYMIDWLQRRHGTVTSTSACSLFLRLHHLTVKSPESVKWGILYTHI